MSRGAGTRSHLRTGGGNHWNEGEIAIATALFWRLREALPGRSAKAIVKRLAAMVEDVDLTGEDPLIPATEARELLETQA